MHLKNGEIVFRKNNGQGQFTRLITGTGFIDSTNPWYTIKITRYENANWSLFVDDVLIGTAPDNSTFIDLPYLLIGRYGNYDNILVTSDNTQPTPEITITPNIVPTATAEPTSTPNIVPTATAEPTSTPNIVPTTTAEPTSTPSIIPTTTAELTSTPSPGNYAISINNGDLFTKKPKVTVYLTASSSTSYFKISNDGGLSGVEWQPYTETVEWEIDQYSIYTLPRIVYVRFKDVSGAETSIYSDDIILDILPPMGSWKNSI